MISYKITHTNTKKAEFYAKLTLKFTPKTEPSMKRQAYKILESKKLIKNLILTKVDSKMATIHLYFGSLKEATKELWN